MHICYNAINRFLLDTILYCIFNVFRCVEIFICNIHRRKLRSMFLENSMRAIFDDMSTFLKEKSERT